MAFTKKDQEKMDRAADDARKELDTMDTGIVTAIAAWWRKWFGDAGHKRLGRALLEFAPEEESKE